MLKGRKPIFFLIAALIAGLLAPAAGPVLAADPPTTTQSLNAEADLLWDSNFGSFDNDLNGRIYIGKGFDSGPYTARGAFRFNLDSNLSYPDRPIKYELQLYVNLKEGEDLSSFYLDVYGSSNNDMGNGDGAVFPQKTSVNYARISNSEIPNGGFVTFDVTPIVDEITNAADRQATFVIEGNESLTHARAFIGSKEYPIASYRPKLIVTYSLNNPPTGSIAINNGAVYTNSSSVTLNLTASDPDVADVLQMRFSNDQLTWSNWENVASSKSWTLPQADGVRTVYYQITDGKDMVTLSATIMLDTVSPVVSGVTHGGLYNSNRTITFNEGSATLNGSPFTSGTTVTGEGTYLLIVTDAAGNTTSLSFTIDKTAPVVSGVSHHGIYNTNRTITFNEGTATLNGSSFTSGTTVSVEGSYTLVVTDAAGNVTMVSFTIDKTAAAVTGVADGENYSAGRTITFNEGTATLNGNPFTSGSDVNDEGDYTLIVTDEAGNVTTIEFTIDKTAPTVSGVTDGSSYNTDQSMTFNEGTATMNGDPFVSGTSVSAEGHYTLVVTDAAGNVTTVFFTIDKTNPVITGLTAGISNYTSPLTIGFDEGVATLNGQPFVNGTRIASYGNYTLVVTDAAGNQTSVTFTLNIPTSPSGSGSGSESSSGSSSSSSSSSNSNSNSGSGLEIEIDGVKQKDLGKGTTAVISGKKVTTVTFDETKLSRYLVTNKPFIFIPVHNDSDRVLLRLNGQFIKILHDQNAVVQIQTELSSYIFAANGINWNLIAKSLGSEDALRNMEIQVEITHVPDSDIEQVASKLGTARLVSPVIDFNITATQGGKTIELNKFLSYVERAIVIPNSADPSSKIMTGVTIAKDGNIVPLPTRIVKENGKIFAFIYSLTNSVYAVIENDKTFSDIQEHWAKNDIERAASKLIVQGVSESSFQPNKQITRAEFTVMLVRALGLHSFDQPASFTDVKSGQWYYETASIAEGYGLVTASNGSEYLPDEKLSRGEAMVLLAKAMKLAGLETTITDREAAQQLSLFKDHELLDPSARTAAALNVKYGIVKGNRGLLTPDSVITRAETTVILQRFLEAAKLS